MIKFVIFCGMSFLLTGCETPMPDPGEHNPPSSYVGTNGPPSATPAEHATVDPTRNELNHSGVMDQNSGSNSTGATGNSGSR
jgi:hypothetical protein